MPGPQNSFLCHCCKNVINYDLQHDADICCSDDVAETFHAYTNVEKPLVVQQSTTWTRVFESTQTQSAIPAELQRAIEFYCAPRLASYGVIATAYL
jgi:hypothetical protein